MITIFLEVELGHVPSGPPGSTHPNRSKHVVLPILVVNADGLQRPCHSGTGTPQFKIPIRESGQVRTTETDKVTVHTKPSILPIVLQIILINDKGMNTPPLGKSPGTRLSGGIEASLEHLEFWQSSESPTSKFKANDLVDGVFEFGNPHGLHVDA